MRFLPEGPNIPDELLEERDNGNVVFLCGAGVSYPAGMPDFLGLAKYVVKELGTPENAPSRTKLSMWDDSRIPAEARPSLDEIFNLLQEEYPAGEIDYLIARRLRARPRRDLSTHEMILRLSRNVEGRPRIVTTNFDLLFDKASYRKLRTHTAPALPDLAGGQSLDGVVYLHGRINSKAKQGEGRQGLVVSSSDFGRAYLAEGWATRFFRELLDRYIVILLGYSASDPPVRYLLQGLHTLGRRQSARLFAFDNGIEEEVKQRWRDKGVDVLAYPSVNHDHSVLWNTLSAWAERADDHLAWRRKVVELARGGPRGLAPYQRGQVASLVRTDIGAKLFADSDPPPPGEWLCVFDYYVRYGDVGRDFTGSQPDFDPLIEYGLDDDPPRPSENLTLRRPPGDDVLSVRFADHPIDSRTQLPDLRGGPTSPLPSRLAQLAGWIAKVVPEPVTAWWVARYWTLHPNLLNQIELHLEQLHEGLPPLARATWRLLIEKLLNSAEDGDPDHAWYGFLQHLNTEGWANNVLRAFARAGEPHLTTRWPFGLNRARPPGEDWSKLHRNDLTEFDVAFPGTGHDRRHVPDESLPAVYQLLRKHLTLAAELLTAIEKGYFKTPTFYPEDKAGEVYLDNRSTCLFWFRELLDRMVTMHPEKLRADIALWPIEEPYFFDKLRLYAWASDVLFSGKEIGEGLLALSGRAFWTTQYHRELLHLLRLRWHDLPVGKRRLLERRLADGPARHARESEEEYQGRRSFTAATNLGWLANNGCELGKKTLDTRQRLRRPHPDWRPEWDVAADESYDGRGGNVRTDSDPTPIVSAPLDEIIPLAKQHTHSSFADFTDHRPFDGLVKQCPRKAVAALTHEARKGSYPIAFWDSTLREWPEQAPFRLVWLFLERLARLPSNVVVELQSTLFRWLDNHFLRLTVQDRTRALRVFDTLLDKLFENGPAATESGLGELYVAGHRQHRSRRTFEHAINGPVGEATKLLLDLLDAAEPTAASHMPADLTSRIERLMVAPGEGADHAICIIARRLRRLDYVDPDWTRATVLPWFNPDNPAAEPAWSGYLVDNPLPAPPLFSLLKPHFLTVFGHASEWNWVDHAFLRLHKFLVIGCFKHRGSAGFISYDEARHALQRTNDRGRTHSINCLNHDVLDGNRTKWQRFGKPFLKKAWPQEDRFRTEGTSREFAELAEKAGDFFPEVVATILPYLVPISGEGLFAYPLARASNEEGVAPATRFPDATLALIDKLVPENPSQMPYELDIVLELIAVANQAYAKTADGVG